MKALVIGGGIGGLTTALSLEQKGIHTELYEAAPELRAAGAGIWMSPNSILALERLGLAEKFLKIGVEMKEAVVEDGSGRVISRAPMDPIKKKLGYAIRSVRRSSLHEILAGALSPGVVRVNKRLVEAGQDAPGGGNKGEDGNKEGEKNTVYARFADGETVRGDLLVGADGIRSTVREAVAPGVPLRYSGQTCWYGLSRTVLPDNRRNRTTEIWMGKTRFGFTEVDGGLTYFFAVEKSPAGLDSPSDPLARLHELYGDAPEIVRDILAGTRNEDLHRGDLSDIKPFLPLAYGRIGLIGDAGHATTPNLGQGAAQAMEDAVALGELCARFEPAEALRKLERLRKKRIAFIVNTSRRMGRIAHAEGFLGERLIPALMRRTPEALGAKMMLRILTPVFS